MDIEGPALVVPIGTASLAGPPRRASSRVHVEERKPGEVTSYARPPHSPGFQPKGMGWPQASPEPASESKSVGSHEQSNGRQSRLTGDDDEDQQASGWPVEGMESSSESQDSGSRVVFERGGGCLPRPAWRSTNKYIFDVCAWQTAGSRHRAPQPLDFPEDGRVFCCS